MEQIYTNTEIISSQYTEFTIFHMIVVNIYLKFYKYIKLFERGTEEQYLINLITKSLITLLIHDRISNKLTLAINISNSFLIQFLSFELIERLFASVMFVN